MSNRFIFLVVLLFAGIVILTQSVFFVDEREQAIVVRFGNPRLTIQEPGLQFKVPFAENVIRMDKRILSLDVPPQQVLTRGQKRILVDSFARFRISDPLKTYQAVRNEFGAQEQLTRIMQSSVRQVLAEEPMQNIVSGERAALMERISGITNDRAANLGLEILDVRLKRVDLPQQNSEAIFRRMEAERKREANELRATGDAEALKITSDAERQVAVTIANAEKEAQILRGEADGKAVKIFADAFGQDQDFFEFYRTMQAYRNSLNKEDTTLILSPDSEFFKLFNAEDKDSR